MTTQGNEQAVAQVEDQQNTTIVSTRNPANNFLIADLQDSSSFPDLSEQEVFELDLMSDYWTPDKTGEFKNVIFSHIEKSLVENKFDPSKGMEERITAFFFEQLPTGEYQRIRNSSALLVGLIDSSSIVSGTALRIVYKGKKKNKTNSFQSDNWSVYAFKKGSK